MKKIRSTRDALEELQRIIESDSDRAEELNQLTEKLKSVASERARVVEKALELLQGYVAFQTEVHGFDSTGQHEPTKHQPVAKKAKSHQPKKAAAKKQKKSPASEVLETGYPHELDRTITFSDKESVVIDLLKSRWPLFTPPTMMVDEGAFEDPHQSTAMIARLRHKGVPIQSAREARKLGGLIPATETGYRLIAP